MTFALRDSTTPFWTAYPGRTRPTKLSVIDSVTTPPTFPPDVQAWARDRLAELDPGQDADSQQPRISFRALVLPGRCEQVKEVLKALLDRLPPAGPRPRQGTSRRPRPPPLYQVVHNRNLISYYEEKSQDLEKVPNIFIRMNGGGTVLSYSDLLLSIAVAQWSGDVRTEIHSLVDDLNDTGEGFNFSKDLVLKAGLMLAGIGNVGFKVENFNRENMEVLEERWPDGKRSVRVAVKLLASFGFNEKTLRADSACCPSPTTSATVSSTANTSLREPSPRTGPPSGPGSSAAS